MAARVTFEVEQAGCSSCAARIREALAPLGAVEDLEVDEVADRATVRLAGSPGQAAVADALAGASEGSGHSYRIRPGSWRAA